MTISFLSFGCFLVLYCIFVGLQRPVGSSFTDEFFRLRRLPLQIENVYLHIFLWHTYSWLRWGLAAAMPFTVLDYLGRTKQLNNQNIGFQLVQFVLFWIMALCVLMSLYRFYCLLYSYLKNSYLKSKFNQRFLQMRQLKWVRKLLGRPPQGDDVRVDLIITSQEAALGCEKTVTLNHLTHCQVCWGNKVLPRRKPHRCLSCLGTGLQSDRHTCCTTCEGLGLTFFELCSACHGSGESPNPNIIKVQVPGGVAPKTRLRIAEKGQPAINPFMLPGDLYIYLSIEDKTK